MRREDLTVQDESRPDQLVQYRGAQDHVAEHVRTSIRSGLHSLAQFSVAALLGWVLLVAVPQTPLPFSGYVQALWIAVLVVVLFFQWRSAASTATLVSDRLVTLAIWSFLNGLWWGLSCVLLYPELQDHQWYFVIFGLSAVTLVVIGGLYLHLESTLGFLASAILPPLLQGLLSNHLFPSLMWLVFWLVSLRVLFLLRSAELKNLRLRYEQAELLDLLTQQARALDDANLARSKFLAQASHDLRQPLHAVGLFMESIADYPADTKVGHVIAQVRASVEMLGRLFNSLIDTSLLDAGQVEADLSDIPLKQILEPLERDLLPIASSRGILLTVVPTKEWVHADAVLLRRMVQNLMSNALRYANSKVLVGVRRRSNSLEIQVLDDGPGVSSNDQKRIFAEFVRVEEGRATAKGAGESGGLGLGLSIVKRLAELMGLEVGIASTPGQGSRFWISGLQQVKRTPLATSGDSASFGSTGLDDSNSPAMSLLSGLQILLIDDDTNTLQATASLLSKWGASVHTSTVVTYAFESPDFVICDYDLGNAEFDNSGEAKTGLDVVAHYSKFCPCVLISGTADQFVQQQAVQQGAVYLSKPVNPAKLRSTLLALLKRSQSNALSEHGEC